jgi:hypothetical protein
MRVPGEESARPDEEFETRAPASGPRSQLPATTPEIGNVAVRVGSKIGRHSFDRTKEVAYALRGPLIQNAVRQFDVGSERGADHVSARPLASTSPTVELIEQPRRQTNRYLSLREAKGNPGGIRLHPMFVEGPLPHSGSGMTDACATARFPEGSWSHPSARTWRSKRAGSKYRSGVVA